MDLVILAAGMGSRFGGLKQAEPVDDYGNFIIDYSIYDAIKEGFDRVIFIIKEENYDLFRETVGKRIESKVKVDYVFQNLNTLLEGYSIPEGRVKPWGTVHAILCCKDIVKNDFLVINADDFYGHDAYRVAKNYIQKKHYKIELIKSLSLKSSVKSDFGFVAYKAIETLSENGSTKRGLCSIQNGIVQSLDECVIECIDGKYYATPIGKNSKYEIFDDQLASMNFFIFTPKIFDILQKEFDLFLKTELVTNPLNCESLITIALEKYIKKGLKIQALSTTGEWFGVTYKKDKPLLVKRLAELSKNGYYPIPLWRK